MVCSMKCETINAAKIAPYVFENEKEVVRTILTSKLTWKTFVLFFKAFQGDTISFARNSERDYKTLFTKAGMDREYNYFKKAKEVVIREDDINIEELIIKLIN